MASRRRRPSRLPWVILALIGFGLAGIYYLWLKGETSPQESKADHSVSIETDDSQRREASARVQPTTTSQVVSGEIQREATVSTGEPLRSVQPAEPVARPSRSETATSSGTGRNTRPTNQSTSVTEEASIQRNQPEQVVNRRELVSTLYENGRINELMAEGMDLVAEGRYVEGRRVLSEVLFNPQHDLSSADAQTIRDTLASVNQKLIFSTEIVSGDTLAEYYEVQSGDLLSYIAPRYKIPYQFVERINNISANRLRVGEKLKLIKGPFHARIIKHEYRLDVFLRNSAGAMIFVCSYPVGLGEEDSTPIGKWRIASGRKVRNPDWRNPRTGRYYAANDPANPIGEYWMAIEGIDEHTRGHKSYGIHGTIDLDSIGSQASMGCIRLRPKDIEQLYYMMLDGESIIEIVP